MLGETHATPCSNPTTAYSLSGEFTISIVPGVAVLVRDAGGFACSVWSGTVVRSEVWSDKTAWRWEKVPCKFH